MVASTRSTAWVAVKILLTPFEHGNTVMIYLLLCTKKACHACTKMDMGTNRNLNDLDTAMIVFMEHK